MLLPFKIISFIKHSEYLEVIFKVIFDISIVRKLTDTVLKQLEKVLYSEIKHYFIFAFKLDSVKLNR